MKFLLLYFLIAVSSGPSEMEMGLIQIEARYNYTIDFYKKPLDKVKVKSVDMVFDTFHFAMKQPEETMKWFKPEAYWPDYMPLTMRCKSQIKDWSEVVINKETNETLWIKNNARVKYLTWLQYLQNMFAIDRADPANNPIYTRPDITSDEIGYSGKDFFVVKSIQGDWMEISTPEYATNNDVEVIIKSGWIRWKDGNKLLIIYYPTS